MDLLFIISTPEAGKVLLPMVAACRRKGVIWGIFFTNDGVRLLEDINVIDALRCAKRAIVCEHSWSRFMPDTSCPADLGSQTQNSMMVGEVNHIISL
jgi:hypothetical protein